MLPSDFCPTPRKGKIRGSIWTNRATPADFAFSSADTKLGGFNGRSFGGIPLPGGLNFAFPALNFCETLIAHYRTEERTHIVYFTSRG